MARCTPPKSQIMYRSVLEGGGRRGIEEKGFRRPSRALHPLGIPKGMVLSPEL